MSAVQKFKGHHQKTEAQYALEFARLTNAAIKDDTNVPALLTYFNENPGLFAAISPLTMKVELGLIDKITTNAVSSLSILQEFKTRKRQLLTDGASPAEEFLAQNVMLCWLRLHVAEVDRTNAINSGSSIKYMEYVDKALTRAQNRFTRALESLARVRALLNR
jgi:hypothetical protein